MDIIISHYAQDHPLKNFKKGIDLNINRLKVNKPYLLFSLESHSVVYGLGFFSTTFLQIGMNLRILGRK